MGERLAGAPGESRYHDADASKREREIRIYDFWLCSLRGGHLLFMRCLGGRGGGRSLNKPSLKGAGPYCSV